MKDFLNELNVISWEIFFIKVLNRIEINHGPKMRKKCKISIFHFPLFKHKWAQNTLESGLNVMKYHCGLRKKDLLNVEKFHKISTFLAQKYFI